MGKAEVLRELREITGGLVQSEKEFWIAPDFPSGVPKGALVELLGNGATEWLIQLFVANPEPLILWCEQDPKILPTAIFQRGVIHSRIKFILTSGDLHQPLRLALECNHYPFIVAPNRMTEIREFQRLQLLAT